MERFQSLLAQNTSSGSGTALVKMPDGSVRRYPVGSIPEGATPMSIDGQKVEVAPGFSPELVEQGGVMVGKERPTGIARGAASIIDWVTGNHTDLDRLGDGTGVAHRKTGAGEIAPNFEKDVDGEITKTKPEDTRTEIQKKIGKDWDQYLEGQKDLMLEVGKEKFKQEQMARLPDLMHAAFGGSYATAAAAGNANLAQIAAASRPYQFNSVNIPTRTNFASLLG